MSLEEAVTRVLFGFFILSGLILVVKKDRG